MIWQVLGVAFVGVIAITLLRTIKQEYAIFVAFATGIIIILMIMDLLSEAVNIFSEGILDGGGSSGNGSLIVSVVKVVGIGYITEYGASLCKDYGSESIGKKVQLAGKVSIFTVAVPIVLDVITAIKSLVTL